MTETREAEQALIAAVIEAPDRLAELHDVTPHHFHNEELGEIWGVLQTMRGPIDYMTIGEACRLAGHANPVLFMQCKCPAAAAAAEYARIVLEAWRRREFRRIVEDVTPKIEHHSVGGVAWELGHKLQAISGSQGTDSRRYGDVSEQWFDDVTSTEERAGLMWGIGEFDDKIGPLRPGKLIVIAARPGMGKSALAQQIAEAVAEQGETVVFAQTEMSAAEMLTRSVSRRTGIPSWRFVRRELRDRDLMPVVEAKTDAEALPMWVIDRPGLGVDGVRAEAARRGASVVVVDYLQRLHSSEKEEYGRVSAISAALKDMTRGGGPTVIALAQLSRALESRDEKQPIASDLRSSGQIEQDADLIIGLMRPAVYDDRADDSEMIANVIKHREGRPGEKIELVWDGPTTSIKQSRTRIALD